MCVRNLRLLTNSGKALYEPFLTNMEGAGGGVGGFPLEGPPADTQAGSGESSSKNSQKESGFSQRGPRNCYVVKAPVNVLTYSQASSRLTGNHAIVFDAPRNFSTNDFASAVIDLIGEGKIGYNSRISHGRVCLYLLSAEVARSLVDGPQIKVYNAEGELFLAKARPLISQHKRVIVSNLNPQFPDELLKELLEDYDVKLRSSIIRLRSGHPRDKIIKSFRRQFFVDEDDVKKIPGSVKYTIEELDFTEYMQFSSTRAKCFICGQEGHLARFCDTPGDLDSGRKLLSAQVPTGTGGVVVPLGLSAPAIASDLETPEIMETEATTKSDAFSEPPAPDSDVAESKDKDKGFLLPQLSPQKRAFSSSSSSLDRLSQDRLPRVSRSGKVAKKNRPVSEYEKSLLADLEPLRQGPLLDISSEYFQGVSDFLLESHGAHDVRSIAGSLSLDIPQLVQTLNKMYTSGAQGSLKGRLKRILRKLDPSLGFSGSSQNSLTGANTDNLPRRSSLSDGSSTI